LVCAVAAGRWSIRLVGSASDGWDRFTTLKMTDYVRNILPLYVVSVHKISLY